MKLKTKALIIGAICSTSLQSWALDANGIKACMAADTQMIQRSKPLDVEFALTKWQLKSEIFYQVDANRSRLVSESYNFSLLEDYKALETAADLARQEYDRLNKEYEQLNPAPKRESYSWEEYNKLSELHWNKKVEFSNSIYAPVKSTSSALRKFTENIGQSPKRLDYIQEIEAKIAEKGDASQLKAYRAMKSYGDQLLRMIKRATSCDDLHAQYVKLAQEAKVKKNFHLETLSTTTVFRIAGLSKERKNEITERVRESLENDGFEVAAKTFNIDKHGTLMLAGVFGAYAQTMSFISTGKTSSEPIFSAEGELSNQELNSDQLEAILIKEARKGLLQRHQSAQDLVNSSLK